MWIYLPGNFHVCNQLAHFWPHPVDRKLPDWASSQWPVADLWKPPGKTEEMSATVLRLEKSFCGTVDEIPVSLFVWDKWALNIEIWESSSRIIAEVLKQVKHAGQCAENHATDPPHTSTAFINLTFQTNSDACCCLWCCLLDDGSQNQELPVAHFWHFNSVNRIGSYLAMREAPSFIPVPSMTRHVQGSYTLLQRQLHCENLFLHKQAYRDRN